jgi:hypothetical protein
MNKFTTPKGSWTCFGYHFRRGALLINAKFIKEGDEQPTLENVLNEFNYDTFPESWLHDKHSPKTGRQLYIYGTGYTTEEIAQVIRENQFKYRAELIDSPIKHIP